MSLASLIWIEQPRCFKNSCPEYEVPLSNLQKLELEYDLKLSTNLPQLRNEDKQRSTQQDHT